MDYWHSQVDDQILCEIRVQYFIEDFPCVWDIYWSLPTMLHSIIFQEMILTRVSTYFQLWAYSISASPFKLFFSTKYYFNLAILIDSMMFFLLRSKSIAHWFSVATPTRVMKAYCSYMINLLNYILLWVLVVVKANNRQKNLKKWNHRLLLKRIRITKSEL